MHGKAANLVVAGWLMLLVGWTAKGLGAQEPELRNIQFFGADVSRDSIVEVMRGFSFALGVRCQYCHVGGAFESDERPAKRRARFMLRMVETINRGLLPLMADRDASGYEVGCKTCHRGQPRPVLLTDVMRATLDADGPQATAARYGELREEAGLSGTFDFGEWEMNVLGERLAREGRLDDAIAIYEINHAAYPASVAIASSLGALHEQTGDPAAAISYYERVLELDPDHAGARTRLEALREAR